MIITCGKCSTQFYLEHKMLAPTGRKVQCSKCKTIWFQEYSKPIKIKLDNLTDLDKNKIFLPAIIERKRLVPRLIVVSCLFLLALGLGSMLYSGPSFDDHSSLLPVNSLEISSIELAYKKNGQIDINGTIASHKGAYGRVPPMTITLLDENRKKLTSIFIPASLKYLNQGDKYSFYRSVRNDFQAKPKLISVQLENGTAASFYNADLS